MRYRCPYCRHLFDAAPPPACPACGKVMVVPAMTALSERQTRRRAVERIRRECERQKAGLHAPVAPGVWRNPRVYLAVIVGLAVIGGAIFRATDRAARRSVDWVVIGPRERWEYEASDDFWAQHGALAFSSGEYRVYAVGPR